MKIFITNRNWVTWPSAMAELLANQGHEITFIDCGSTYEPLLDYYNKCPFKVIRLSNLGNRAAWEAGIVTSLNEYYVVTDPDYDLSMIPADWPEVLMDGFRQYPQYNKFGFSWDESQVPPENPAWTADEMYKYPQGNPVAWANAAMAGNWYGYPNDTSFAVQRPGTGAEIGGIRKGRPYTGVHLPWHITLEPSKDPTKRYVLMNDEMYYYFTHCENSSFTWARMWESGMLTEYERRKGITPPYKP